MIHSKTILNARLFSILILGFASGLPLALTGTTLQAWFTNANINLLAIGSLTLLGLPYSLKFLWAPLMDHYRLPKFGRRKGWILAMQSFLVIMLFVLANMSPTTQAVEMGVVALVIAFFSASQDISITAYQVDVLKPEERGLGVAYYIFAYRTAALLSGGLALISADYFGWKVTYEAMAGVMFVAMVLTYYAPEVGEPVRSSSQRLFATIKQAVGDLLQREKFIILLLFICSYKLGDALALSLMTNFLLHGLGFTLTEIGVAYKFVGFVGTILGAFVGGLILTRWHVYRALFVFGIAQAFSNLSFALLAVVGKHFTLMASAMFVENFCSGLSTAALFSFMMYLCNHRYTASQFAILSACASVGRVFLGPVASVLVLQVGWMQFFVVSFFMCFPSIVFLVLLKDRMKIYAPVPAK